MSGSAAPDPPTLRFRATALLVLAVLTALIWVEPPWLRRLQAAWFDSMQAVAPRQVRSMPATIVAIDEKSLAALGQWPWPRTLLAQVVQAVARAGPAAIGLDVLMPEADRLSPDRLLAQARERDPELALRLAAIPSNDELLAAAVAEARVVLVAAGTREVSVGTLRATPVIVSGPRGDVGVPHYAGAIANIDTIDAAGAGHGVISVEPSNAVFRRFPLVVDIDGTLAPAFATEMLRVALKEPAVRLARDRHGIAGVSIGTFGVPTEADGAITVHYSASDPRRFVSAADLLAGRVGPDKLAQKLVVVAVTFGGVRDDYRVTPLGEPMSAAELHAQVLENLYDGSYLRRPGWARWLELGLFAAAGLALIHATPRWRPRRVAWLAVGLVGAAVAAAYAAFRVDRLLFDATPSASLVLLFCTLLVMTLAAAARRRRRLERDLQVQREQAAFVKGELDAAQRIQAGMLPNADALGRDPRVDLHAAMTPAREVGGDLYDFFFVDPDRLFLLVGDVAGKGLSASLFMAVSKALCKSVALRAANAPIGDVMIQLNREVSRDNASMLFVSAFIGVLDLRSGVLSYCNAGQENPYALHTGRDTPSRLDGGDGPGLCVVEDFPYRGAVYRMAPGEMLCLATDGVAEAHDAEGRLYGSARWSDALTRLCLHATPARGLVEALQDDVARFVGGAEAADDITVFALRWNGPPEAATA